MYIIDYLTPYRFLRGIGRRQARRERVCGHRSRESEMRMPSGVGPLKKMLRVRVYLFNVFNYIGVFTA
jgi:hypothetical protein